MEIYTIERLLMGTKFEHFIGFIKNVTFNNFLYNSLFKMGNKELGHFSVKIRKKDQQNVIDSINNLNNINDLDNYCNKNIEIIEKEKLIIIISEWLDGIIPIENKGIVPEFFSKLAIFNKNNYCSGPYTSMYLDNKYFDTINELLEWEMNYHKNYILGIFDYKILCEVLDYLKNGIGCIINEDMNCGNIVFTKDGKYKIIDTEWIIKGSNLYQFQHIDYFGFNGQKWYTITEEAEKCYEAYFNTLEVKPIEANEQIRAIELLNIIRENTYWKNIGKENDSEIKRRIKIVLDKEKYI